MYSLTSVFNNRFTAGRYNITLILYNYVNVLCCGYIMTPCNRESTTDWFKVFVCVYVHNHVHVL